MEQRPSSKTNSCSLSYFLSLPSENMSLSRIYIDLEIQLRNWIFLMLTITSIMSTKQLHT